MDGRHFDQIARDQSATRSRRQSLKLLAAGLLAPALAQLGQPGAAAACRAYNQPCGANAACCPSQGTRCQNGRCRCRSGKRRCGGGAGCVDVSQHKQHCGRCGHNCPASKPCCIRGKCRPKCGAQCCEDCFVERLSNGTINPGSQVCCRGGKGTICSRKPGRTDDRCCYPDEVCLDGRCCSGGLYGTTNCGGACCAKAACCGQTCCKNGHVCARKGGRRRCVRANRPCTVKSQCHANEICHGGKCCSGGRVCQTNLGNTPICCQANEYCEFGGSPAARCTHIGKTASTSRGHRIRP